ncbi:hypothetical protein [Haliangium ochraceum]|uniref:Lipoprotein n=1 Tax=Haliangium ochraceum (strain DSM 14365 / JCM 11303 / SMP-2) TaxID=502025 RepID=D0LY88_HALO1|nr:hypothetical protein [Haliangium ochraceum]ACY16238.1 hypothetical protein Hoch_3738 [Haliangium ochraceum DSM 14365]
MRKWGWGLSGLLALTAFALAACSSASHSGSTGPGGDGAQVESEEAAREREARAAAMAELRRRQEAACEGAAGALFTCAVADAEANMSAEEFAALEVDTLESAYRADFIDSCTANQMSLRQVKVYEQCLGDTACEVFIACLDEAKPRPESDAPAAPNAQ